MPHDEPSALAGTVAAMVVAFLMGCALVAMAANAMGADVKQALSF